MSRLTKKYNGNFTQFSNDIFKQKLPLKTIGLFALMWSFPNNWNFTVKGLTSLVEKGESLVKKSIIELGQNGFIKRTYSYGEKGHKRVDYELSDIPRAKKPSKEKHTY